MFAEELEGKKTMHASHLSMPAARRNGVAERNAARVVRLRAQQEERTLETGGRK